MCASIESYANDRALDAAITVCMDFIDSTDKIVTYVEKKYPEIENSVIISRVTFLWNQKNENK